MIRKSQKGPLLNSNSAKKSLEKSLLDSDSVPSLDFEDRSKNSGTLDDGDDNNDSVRLERIFNQKNNDSIEKVFNQKDNNNILNETNKTLTKKASEKVPIGASPA